MISVIWDSTLPKQGTPVEEELKRWDEWFASAGIGEEWENIKMACKEVGATHQEIIRWAQITELTRLGKLTKLA